MIAISKTVNEPSQFLTLTDADSGSPMECNVGIEPNYEKGGSIYPTPTYKYSLNGYTLANITTAGKNLFSIDNLSASRSRKNANFLAMSGKKDAFYLTGATLTANNNILVVGKEAYLQLRLFSKWFEEDTAVTFSCKVKNYTDLNGLSGYIKLQGHMRNTTPLEVDSAEFSTVGVTNITLSGTIVRGRILELEFCPVYSEDSSVTLTQYTEIYDMQIEFGNTASAYSPTRSVVESFQLGGTVYQGNLQMNKNGSIVLTETAKAINMIMVDWFYDSEGGYFYSEEVADLEPDTTNIFCTLFDGTGQSYYNEKISVVGKRFRVITSTYADLTAFTEGVTGEKLVYGLDTPIVRTLSATAIIDTKGHPTTIWSNLGGTINETTYMSTDSSAYGSLIESGRPQHIRLTFLLDNVVFEDGDFNASNGCAVTSYMNPDIDMTFGVAYMSDINLAFFRSEKTDQLTWTREFKVELGVEDSNGDTEWIQVGIFAGKRPLSVTDYVIEFQAYDRMQRFDKKVGDFLSLLTFPCTLQDIYETLCSFVGVTNVTGDEIPNIMNREFSVAPDLTGIETCRDLLAEIAEATGCYARMTPNGDVKLVWFEDHTNDYSLMRDNIFGIESTDLTQAMGMRWNDLTETTWTTMTNIKWSEMYYRENAQVYDGITATWGEDSYTEPSVLPLEARVYTIEDNPFVYHSTEQEIRDHLQMLLNRISTFNIYYVANVVAVGNWLVEPGDVVSIELEDGSFKTYPIFSRTLTWNGYCECEYESTGNLVQ